MKILLNLIMLIAVLTLSACGGGGGSDDGGVDGNDNNPSITPLDILSTSPLDGDSNVNVNAKIQVVFTKSIDFENLNLDELHLVSDTTGVEVPGTLDYDEQSFTLEFTPDYLLATDTQYTIQIDAGIADSDNQVLGSVSQSFATNDNYRFSFESASEQCQTDCDYELWAWDENGDARLLADINPDGSSFPQTYDMVRYKGLYYFTATTPEHGSELWVTDGTEGFTQLFMDLRSGVEGSSPYQFIVFNDLLYFVARAEDGFQYIWRTDGTTQGTKPIANNFDNASPHTINNLTVLGDRLLYVAFGDTINGGTQYGWEVFATDGSDDTHYLIKDLNPGSGLSGAGDFVVFGDKVYFSASDGSASDGSGGHSYSLFVSDGSEGNMALVKDINPTSNDSSEARIFDLMVYNNQLIFTALDGVTGRQLWVSDGTPEGTNILKMLNNGAPISVSDFIEFNGLLYFAERKNDRFWVTDGTEDGTQLIKTFDKIDRVFASDAGLLMSATLGDSTGLWISDGTDEGTLHYYPTTSLPYLTTSLGGGVIFIDNDFGSTPFFFTDGTFNGTFQLLSENGLPFQYDAV